MIERFLAQTTFTSEEDFKEHLKFKAKEASTLLTT